MSLDITPRMREFLELAGQPNGLRTRDYRSSGTATRQIKQMIDAGYLWIDKVTLKAKNGLPIHVYRRTEKPVPQPMSKQEREAAIVRNMRGGWQTPTVVLSGTVASRAKLLDPATTARITSKTKYTKCPHSPVYSNVQVAPGEKVPRVFSCRPGIDPMTGRPWA